MDEHHEGVAFTGRILFLFKKGMNQLWGIRDEEVKVSGKEKSLDYYNRCCTFNYPSPSKGYMYVLLQGTFNMHFPICHPSDACVFFHFCRGTLVRLL